MIKTRLYIALTILCSIIVFGCDSKDDYSIQITVNGFECKPSSFSVPADGGIFEIFSPNYGLLWLNAIKKEGKIVYDQKFNSASYLYTHVTGDWYEVYYDAADEIVVKIQPNNGVTTRSISLELQHGDVFRTITFLQDLEDF